jgi:cytochrome c-type biogenesis protein CcsB
MTSASNAAFGAALVLYLVAMVGYFHFLAYRRRRPLVAARVAAFAGLAVHGLSIALRGAAAGRVPWGNMYEYASVVGFFVVGVYLLLLERRRRMERLGGFALGATVLIMAGATMLYVAPGPLIPALNSYWLRIHVLAAIVSSALFTLGFIFTALYLVQERRERRGAREPRPAPRMARVGAGMPHDLEVETDPEEGTATVTLGPAEGNGHAGEGPRSSRLPDATALDSLAHKVIAFAFPLWTFAVIAGAIWAEQAWGRYWGWDPKETWSFVTWVFFAGYLHARATQGWRGRRAAIIAVLGFVALVFNLVVVNLVVSGLHSYAGV